MTMSKLLLVEIPSNIQIKLTMLTKTQLLVHTEERRPSYIVLCCTLRLHMRTIFSHIFGNDYDEIELLMLNE